MVSLKKAVASVKHTVAPVAKSVAPVAKAVKTTLANPIHKPVSERPSIMKSISKKVETPVPKTTLSGVRNKLPSLNKQRQLV